MYSGNTSYIKDMVVDINALRKEYNRITLVGEGTGYTSWYEGTKSKMKKLTIEQLKDYQHYVSKQLYYYHNERFDMEKMSSNMLENAVAMLVVFFAILSGFYNLSTEILKDYANKVGATEQEYLEILDFWGRSINQVLLMLVVVIIVFCLYRLTVCIIEYLINKSHLKAIDFYEELAQIVNDALLEQT